MKLETLGISIKSKRTGRKISEAEARSRRVACRLHKKSESEFGSYDRKICSHNWKPSGQDTSNLGVQCEIWMWKDTFAVAEATGSSTNKRRSGSGHGSGGGHDSLFVGSRRQEC
jgi:hypothetical protein